MIDQARRLADAHHPTVVVAGGDGTLNIAARGLIGSDTALGILPIGTMNVLARELRYPLLRLHKTLDLFDQAHTKDIDIFLANDVPILQLMGVGLDALTIKNTTEEHKKCLSGIAYLVQGSKALSQPQIPLTVATAEGENLKTDFLAIGNGGFYGGQMRLFPKASLTSGFLDILLMTPSLTNLFGEIIRALLSPRSLPNPKRALYRQTTALTITSPSPVPFEIDGDYIGETPIRIEKSPYKLKIICPK